MFRLHAADKIVAIAIINAELSDFVQSHSCQLMPYRHT